MASPLIKLIKKNDAINALALIATGRSNPGIVDTNGKTALIYACIEGMSDVALALIETGNSDPEIVDHNGKTALIYACSKSMSDVALALIATGQSNPRIVDEYEKTALIYACQLRMNDVALALIETGNSNPRIVDNNGKTALIYACQSRMNDVALALIATGDSNPSQVDGSGRTALIFAQRETMQEVVELLLQVAPPAAPVAPPVAQRGVAFEIHNFFNLLDIKKITKFITQFNDSKPEFNNNVLPFSLDPLLSPLINFVNNTYPENVKQDKINGLRSINAYIASYGGYRELSPLLQKVITFVSKQSDEFITQYIDMLKYDCLNAYAGSAGSNKASCIKGMVERIVTVLKDVAIVLLTKDPDNEYYVKLKDIFMEFNEFIGEWSNTYLEDGPKHRELEALTEEERENHFITFMVKKYTDDDDPNGRECSPDGSKCSPEMCAKIKTEAVKFRDMGVFKNLVMGGNKKRYKRKTHKKKNTRKIYKKKFTRNLQKKVTRKKLQKSYKKLQKTKK